MAALTHPSGARVVDLHDVAAGELDAVLEEERLTWRALLHWDFSASAELVRRFVKIRALNGHALLINGRVAGYSYYVCEERKALIGDIYVERAHATSEHEDMLLAATLRDLAHLPYLDRIEAQLMMLHGHFERPLPYARFLRVAPRNFMLADLDDTKNLEPGAASEKYTFEHWSEAHQEEAARLIAAAYKGHIDSNINDQYRSVSGAHRFLTNIIQYPGCGAFFGPASLVARDAEGKLGGLCLGSMVAADVGHITQICVAPEAQGTGLGFELMRRSLGVFADQGCEKASLTVTASNSRAIQLYQRLGYRAVRRFAAYVWEGF
jgi:ribosomal protein S18 acetylase RimI-like enzyme